MFSQSLSEHNLNLVVRERDQDHCLAVLRREFEDSRGPALARRERLSPTRSHREGMASFRLGVKEKVATVSVVGLPGLDGRRNGVVSRAFAALGQLQTRVISVAQAATEHSVSFCIPEDQLNDAVRFLHRELGLEDDIEGAYGVGIGTPGRGS